MTLLSDSNDWYWLLRFLRSSSVMDARHEKQDDTSSPALADRGVAPQEKQGPYSWVPGRVLKDSIALTEALHRPWGMKRDIPWSRNWVE